MIERVYYRVKLDANTFIYTPYLSNIPTSITDIPTNVTYDTTDGITLKTKETWTYDNNESSSVIAEREIPLKAGDGVTMDVSEDGEYVVIKADPKRETYIGTSVPTDDYPDLFVNTADDSLSYKAFDGSWKPIAGGGGLVDDVIVNGVSVVTDKIATIPVDLEQNANSSNPIANKTVVIALDGLSIDINSHKHDTTNPHNVTAAQIGLGNVDNTSDTDKPVSTAQQTALDKKIDKTGGTFSGNVAIQGDLTVSGTTTTETEKQLAIKENVIVTNADKTNLQTLLSGLAINKNSTATYGIMYDPADDTVKFGEGTLDANRKFVFKAGEGHPLAIRADSSQFADAVLVKWNATTKAFEPASGTWQNLLDKIEITDIDLTLGDETVLYDTTNGIQLSATGKITRKDGTSEQPQVDLDIPIVPGEGIIIDKVADKEQVEAKVDTSVVALKSDLIPYAKTADVVAKSQVGAASGVASLGTDGKVPAAQLPTIDNYSKFSEVKLQNSNIVPAYSTTTGITVTSTGSMKHTNNIIDTPTNTMVVPIKAGANMSATKNGNLIVFAADAQVGVGATLPAGSDSEKIFINTAENTAKVYYNDNGTWKVVDVQGGGGGSIDADTLNGLLKAGTGISIGKTTAGDKVEVKIDTTANIRASSFITYDDLGNRSCLYSDNLQYWDKEGDRYILSFPDKSGALTTENSFKTLFGNQNIIGSGNIDLYRHSVRAVEYAETPAYGHCDFNIISSNNLKIDSLTDLKTILGNTFRYPAFGQGDGNSYLILGITENGVLTYSVNGTPTEGQQSWSGWTFTDTVTTV